MLLGVSIYKVEFIIEKEHVGEIFDKELFICYH